MVCNFMMVLCLFRCNVTENGLYGFSRFDGVFGTLWDRFFAGGCIFGGLALNIKAILLIWVMIVMDFPIKMIPILVLILTLEPISILILIFTYSHFPIFLHHWIPNYPNSPFPHHKATSPNNNWCHPQQQVPCLLP